MNLKTIAVPGILASLSTSLLILSCQREPGVEGTPPPSLNDSAYLSMIVYIDTTFAVGVDTGSKEIISYDAQKRVSRVDFYDYFLGTPGSGSLSNVTTYHYNGNDTLPYKVDEDFFGRESYLFYENGFVVKDSMIFTDPGFLPYDKLVVTYTKLAGNRHRFIERYTLNGGHVDSDTAYGVVTRNSFGEIVHERDSLYRDAGMAIFEYSFIYDNHPNPRLRMMQPYPVWTVDWNPYAEWSYHNYTSLHQYTKDENGVEQNTTYNPYYWYRADGYPVLAKTYNDFGGDEDKVYYYYKRL